LGVARTDHVVLGTDQASSRKEAVSVRLAGMRRVGLAGVQMGTSADDTAAAMAIVGACT
jgi:hypothetical protein